MLRGGVFFPSFHFFFFFSLFVTHRDDIIILKERKSIRFLECVEHCFLIQMLDLPTRKEALLDLLLTNQQNLLCNISISGTLGFSDHNIVEFGILLNILKLVLRQRF